MEYSRVLGSLWQGGWEATHKQNCPVRLQRKYPVSTKARLLRFLRSSCACSLRRGLLSTLVAASEGVAHHAPPPLEDLGRRLISRSRVRRIQRAPLAARARLGGALCEPQNSPGFCWLCGGTVPPVAQNRAASLPHSKEALATLGLRPTRDSEGARCSGRRDRGGRHGRTCSYRCLGLLQLASPGA